jgi:hypothetical protein
MLRASQQPGLKCVKSHARCLLSSRSEGRIRQCTSVEWGVCQQLYFQRVNRFTSTDNPAVCVCGMGIDRCMSLHNSSYQT